MFRPLLTAISLIAVALLAADVIAQPARGPSEAAVRSAMSMQRPLGAQARIDSAPVERPQADAPSRQQEVRTLSEAVRSVQRRTGGQILGAERVPYEGGVITRIKYMDDRGRVRYMDDPGAGVDRRARPRRDDNDER